VIGVLLVVSFFVTSSDSGSLVVDHLTSGGKLDSPVPQRVFWAVMEGAVAAVLLLGGGLQALQSAAVASGILFALVIMVSIWSLKRALDDEMRFLEAGVAVPTDALQASRIGERMRAEEEAADEEALALLQAEAGEQGGEH
jgi:choline/glycine/proline betaine transport protein